MKQATLAIGVAGLICIACAADLRDAHDTVNAETSPTKLAAEATATVQPDQSNDESGKTSEPSRLAPRQLQHLNKSQCQTKKREFLAPFRGTPIDSTELYSPPLALKIDNAPTALPQQGLQDADIVFEELVEGGLTGFLAFSLSKFRVGWSYRSGRSTDIPLLMPFDGALFGWSGSNWAFRKLLDTVAITDVGSCRNPSHYWRKTDRISPSSNLWVHAPHNFQ